MHTIMTVNFKAIYKLLPAIFILAVSCTDNKQESATQVSELVKVKDIVIYQDSMFYSAFPSVVKRPDGELIVAFRRAPNRHIFGEGGNSHVDPNSYLVLVRSKDGEPIRM